MDSQTRTMQGTAILAVQHLGVRVHSQRRQQKKQLAQKTHHSTQCKRNSTNTDKMRQPECYKTDQEPRVLPKKQTHRHEKPFLRTPSDVKNIPIENQVADILTKTLPGTGFLKLRESLQRGEVHLGRAPSIDRDLFLIAFPRFVGRRGAPTVMFSENWTNLWGKEAVGWLDWANFQLNGS